MRQNIKLYSQIFKGSEKKMMLSGGFERLGYTVAHKPSKTDILAKFVLNFEQQFNMETCDQSFI